MSSSPSSALVAREALRDLRAAADPDRRDGQRAYFKAYEEVHFFGVATPQVKAIGRAIYAEVKAGWALTDAVDLCDRLVHRRELEAKTLGLFVLARFERQFTKGLLRRAKTWLAADLLATWAAVDAVAPWIVAPLIRRYPDLGGTVRKWTGSRSLWVRRAAAVSFIPLARRGARLDDAYAVAEALLDSDHHLLQKATGWLLREAGKPDRRRLEAFLRAHGPRIPRTTVRYAIERFPETTRRRLLAVTR